MDSDTRRGAALAVAAFAFWGFTPLYYKLLTSVAPGDILAHRILWTVVIGVLIVGARRDWARLRSVIRSPRTLAALLLSSVLISLNWLVYIYAVTTDRVLETSLGYYINPLVNVFLGMVFLGERMTLPRAVAVILAGLGTLNLALGVQGVPWIALTLGFSFGLYGLVRKRTDVPVVGALLGETGFLVLPALMLLGWLHANGVGAFLVRDWRIDLLLIAGGPVTMLPLLWFTLAARRLPLAAIGMFQYLAPSITFLLAVVVFAEPFTRAHGVTFALIWSGLVLSTLDAIWRARRVESVSGGAGIT